LNHILKEELMKRKTIFIGLMVGLLVVSLLVPTVSLAQEKAKVSFWHAMGWMDAYIKRMAEDFSFYYPETKLTSLHKGTYTETLTAVMAAAGVGDAPHVFQTSEIGTKQAYDSGYIIPIADLVKVGEVDWTDFLRPLLDNSTIGGKTVSIPWNNSSPVLYYNKNIFKKAGLNPDNPPTTWEDVTSACRKIVATGAAKYGIVWPLHQWWYVEWMTEQGQDVVNNENGRAGTPTESYLLSEASVRIFKFWKQLYDEKLYVNPGIEAWTESNQIFWAQKAGMAMESTAAVRRFLTGGLEGGYEVGVSVLPTPKGIKRHGIMLGGGTLFITKGHPEKEIEAAKEFLKWMSLPEQTIRWHKATGYYPSRHSAVDILELTGWFKQYPGYRVAFDQLLESEPGTKGPLMGNYREVTALIEETLEKVFAGRLTVNEALTEAKQKIDKLLAEYARIVG